MHFEDKTKASQQKREAKIIQATNTNYSSPAVACKTKKLENLIDSS
jgi:hypothetical protein